MNNLTNSKIQHITYTETVQCKINTRVVKSMQQEISCSYSHAMVYGFNAFDYFLNLQKEEKSRFTKFTTYKIWHCSWRQNSIGAICKSIKPPTNAACSICDNAKA